MLATVSLADGNLVVTDGGGSTNDNVTVFANAANQRYEISDFANLVTTSISGATGSGTTTVHVPFAAVTGTQLSVAFQGGNDTTNIRGDFPVSVAIDGGAGTDNVNFNGDLTLAAGRSLATTVETLDVFAGTDIVTSGAGSVALLANSMVVSGTITSAATIKLTADSLLINSTTTIASAADVEIEKLSFTGGVTLGSKQSGRLSLTDDELDRITSATTRLKNAAESGFLVTNAITHANHLELLTPGPGGTQIEAPITMAANKNLTVAHSTLFAGNPHTRLINSNADITTSGTGAISFLSQSAFDMASGSSLTTENGGITVLARGGSTSYLTYNVEIHGTVTSTGAGNISITSLSSTGQRGGMLIQGTVQSTSAANAPTQGRIRIEGVNGANDGANLHGVHIAGAGLISSDGGDIEIIGRGGVGSVAVGVQVRDSSGGILARNNASISIDGTGGVGNAPVGFYFQRNTAASATSTISSQNGSIAIRGVGGTTAVGSDADGASFFTSSAFATTTPMVSSVQGSVLIEGNGGSSTSLDHGIVASNGRTAIASSGGQVTLRGVAGAASNSYAISTTISGTSGLTAYQSGSIVEFQGDTFQFIRTSAAAGRLATAATGVVAFAPTTPGTPITVGGVDVLTGTERLGLSDAELDAVLAHTIRVGGAASGDVAIDAAIIPEDEQSRNMELLSGGDIVFNANLSTVGTFSVETPATGSLLLAPGPGGGVRPLATLTDVTTRTGATQFPTMFAPGADLKINIAGTTLDSQYNQLRTVGAVDLAGADLSVTGSFVTTLGQVFTIVSANAITGQFNGLLDNCSLVHNGRSLRVNYGATNVTLTDVGQPPTINADSLAVATGEGSLATNTGTFNDPDGNATALVTASIGMVTQDNAAGTWSWSLPTTDGPAGPFMVTITVTDPWCAMDHVTFEYSVNNLPPTVAHAGPATVNEGQTATNTGTWGDPGVDDVALAASVGAVVKNANGTWSWSFGASDGPDQSQMVTITATDSDGAQSQTTFQLTVNNVPAAVTSFEASTDAVAQGGTVSFSGAFADPGDELWTGTAIIQRAAAADVVVPVTLNADKTLSFNYVFAASGLHTVTVAVDDGGPGAPMTRQVAVNVVAPPLLPGDYDRDNDVDGFDFLLWQRQLGAATMPYAEADGDGNRIVAGGDLSVWRDNFGAPEAATAAAAASASGPGQVASQELLRGSFIWPGPWPPGRSAGRQDVERSPRARAVGVDQRGHEPAAREHFFSELGGVAQKRGEFQLIGSEGQGARRNHRRLPTERIGPSASRAFEKE
jgi:hypothetical protein